jgi:hypothetical protein
MSLLLLLLYPIAVQYERGGLWRIVMPITLVTLVIDVIANYTELALLTWDFPQEGEYTFSDRLVRLKHNGDWRGVIARMAVWYCDIFFEGHIK